MVVVNQSESSASAATELRLHAVDGNNLLLDLKLLSESLFDHGLLQATNLRVDNFDLLCSVSEHWHLRLAFCQAWGFSRTCGRITQT